MRLFLITAVSLSTSVAAASMRECEDKLILDLAKRAYQRVAEHDARLGTPGRTLEPESLRLIGARPDEDFLGKGTLVPTAFGWAHFETPEALAEWTRLAAFVKIGPAAKREILEIIADRDYCTPGIDPELCEGLRDSHDAVAREIEARGGDLTARGARAWGVVTGGGDIEYPWRPHGGTFATYMTPGQALKTMILFVREATLRHLVFRDETSAWRSGRELDLDTRMAMSLRPFLAPLANLFLHHPPEYIVAHLIDDVGSIGLYSQSFEFGAEQWAMNFLFGVDLNSKKVEEVAAFFSAPYIETPSADKLETLRSSLQWIIEDAGHRFAELTSVGHEIKVRTEFSVDIVKKGEPRMFPYLNVHVTGLGRAQQILFFHFVAREFAQLR